MITLRSGFLALMALGLFNVGFAAPRPAAPPATPPAQASSIHHRFLALDFMLGKLHYIDESHGDKNFSMPWAGGVRDLQLLENQQLLISNPAGYTLYDLKTRSLVKEVKPAGVSGVTSVQRLANGHSVLAGNVKRRDKDIVVIWEFDEKNQLFFELEFPMLHFVRMIRPTSKETWLVAEYEGATEVKLAPDLSPEQRIVKQFKMPPKKVKSYMALRREDGTTLLAGGYAAALYVFGPDGKIQKELVAPQPAGMINWFYAGLEILPNGNILQANWNGHNAKDYKPGLKLLEFDAEGKVVWSWNEKPDRVGTINGIILLDNRDVLR